MLGIPQLSRRIVNEKQQLIRPCSEGAVAGCPRLLPYPGRSATGELATELVFGIEVMLGLYRSTHDVSTAF
jgi:hypothetical protein